MSNGDNTPTVQERYVIKNNDISNNVYNLYFFNDKFGLFQELDNEAAEVIYDNFWITGAPESGWETDENFLVVQENAGNLQNMISPVLGELEVVDYSNLEKEILDASELDLTKYTEETVKVFKEALEKAQAVMENSDATQAEADAAVAELRSAIDALETLNEKPEKSEKPEKPEVPERPSKPSDNKPVDDSVKTGDASSFTYWIIVMVGVAVVGIVVICRRKYR